MTGIDYFAWVVLIVIIITAIVVIIALCRIPGNIAKANNHPQADAINIAGWLGLLLSFGVIWVLALIWAKAKPISAQVYQEENSALKQRIKELEADIAKQQGANQ